MLFTYNQNQPLHGILFWLFHHSQNKYFQNVQVSTTSCHIAEEQCQIGAIDFTNYYWISSGDHDPEYLTIYFPKHSIKITDYVIQTSNTTYESGCHPKKWTFSVSSDGSNFQNEEEVTDTEETIRGPLKTFHVTYQHGIFNYFRISPKETTCDQQNKNYFDLNQIELFGELYFSQLNTFKHSQNIHFIPFIFLTIFMK